MKKLTLLIAATVVTAGLALAAPQQGEHSGHTAKTSTAKKGAASSKARRQRAVVGFISDSHCGLKHMEGMGDEAACTLKCVEGSGKFVLADRARKVVYNLDRVGQEKAREFAGRKVKITGRVTGRTIHVTNIEASV